MLCVPLRVYLSDRWRSIDGVVVALWATRGFGKNTLTSPETRDLLGLYLIAKLKGEITAGGTGSVNEQVPDEYQRFVIDDVRRMGDTLTLVYGGHVFGGIVRCLLDTNGVEDALRPGREVFVRYHIEETGAPGQVAHIIIRHPTAEGWAEVYSDGV